MAETIKNVGITISNAVKGLGIQWGAVKESSAAVNDYRNTAMEENEWSVEDLNLVDQVLAEVTKKLVNRGDYTDCQNLNSEEIKTLVDHVIENFPALEISLRDAEITADKITDHCLGAPNPAEYLNDLYVKNTSVIEHICRNEL